MRIHLLCILCIAMLSTGAQPTGDTSALTGKQLVAYLDKTTARIEQLDVQAKRSIDKLLENMQRQEQRIAGKLREKDAAKYQALFGNSGNLYRQLETTAGTVTDSLQLRGMESYIPYLDTLKTSFRFLGTGNDAMAIPQLDAAGSIVQQFENRLDAGNSINTAVQERVALLTSQLQDLGFIKELKALNKQVIDYRHQLESYKAMLNDPKQLEAKAIELLSRTKAFRDFMQQNSMLAQLFPMPADYGTARALTGLQTRSGMQQLLQQRFGTTTGAAGTAGQTPQQYMQQQVQNARSQLNELQEKINTATGGNTELTMPDYKPNSQRTKSFFQRLEFGFNLQNERGRYLLPLTTDIALSLGYKLHDNCVIGIGGSYKIGWGNGWNDIALTSEGVGLRSFADIQLKGSFWLSGGWEYNYLQRFNDISTIKNLDSWQKSGLLGVTKKYRLGRKEGKMQLLWDFMSYSQVPQGQAIKFRLGYTF